MPLVLLLVVFLNSVCGIVVHSPPAFAGTNMPTWLHYSQWGNVDYSKFGKNYSVGGNPGCKAPCSAAELQANVSGLVACADLALVVCPWSQVVQTFQDAGAEGVWFFYGPEHPMDFTGFFPPNMIPLFYPDGWYPDYLTFMPTFATNITIELTYPVTPDIWVDESLGGGLAAVMWIGTAFNAFLLTLSVWKSSAFYFADQKVFSLPQSMFALSFFQAVLGIFNCLALNFFGGVSALPVLTSAGRVFEFWPWAVCCTQFALFGFFLAEVSMITASQSSGGLDKMKIPAAVTIIVVWILTIVVGSLYGANITDASANQAAKGVLLGLMMPCFFVVGVIVLWGCTAVLIAATKGGGSASSIIKICLLGYLTVVVFWAFGGAWFAFRSDPIVLAGQLDQYSNVAYCTFIVAVLVFVPPLISMLFSLSFRLSISKEIEVSKSGTSSTSSGGSSSSSSSSSQDPVIEL